MEKLKEQRPAPAGTSNTPARRKAGDLPASETAHSPSPIALMRRFAEEMDRLFEDFGLRHGVGAPRFLSRGRELLRREVGLVACDWSPEVDVLERDGQFIVRADLPGVARKDLDVEITPELLTIRGERLKAAHEQHEGRHFGEYYSERAHGRCLRSVPLPDGVQTDRAVAHFRDGVLEVSMPCPVHAKPTPRRLEIVESS